MKPTRIPIKCVIQITDTFKTAYDFLLDFFEFIADLTLRHTVNSSGLQKNSWIARGFAWEYLRSWTGYRPGGSVKRCGKSCSLHSKKILCLGSAFFFCEWRHKWRTFWPPWPTSPGPRCQPLDGSISLKFLLKTRLQSESFDTLDDLQGFRVQKLWSK